ncbi:MAG: prolipoprotein diacylglyceryl transferase [Gammaproteobacteria bacterium]|nr:prolipoprotein diacylglyceryl transferase [Gammaproteobacteria bacterium]
MSIVHPGFDPVAFSIGPIDVHWYGLMYLLGFLGGGWLGVLRARRGDNDWTKDQVWDILFYIALGVIVGGRLGYVVFYNLGHYIQHPLELLYVWRGGMSFHGGLIGVIVAMAWYARHTRRSFLAVADFVAPLTALGLGAGRIGNFVNQELWGRAADVPWAVVFPAVDMVARHPSQLYEALLEGALLFVVLWLYSRRPRPVGSVAGIFLVGYGSFRCLVEFFREPDAHLSFIAWGWVTMGQVLSIPLVLFGIWLIARAPATRQPHEAV